MSNISGIFRFDDGARLAGATYTHSETGCVIAAGARIDYRDRTGDSPGDAEYILEAYLRRGERCLEELLGDFAFAIWDPRAQKLVCARDRFGVRPFHYHFAPGNRFLFASNVRAIIGDPQVPYALNEGRIADFLVPELEWIDLTSTFFKDVYRLPPAHMIVVTANGVEISEYWTPEPGPTLHYSTDEEYCEAFLEIFSRAIGERRRGEEDRVGSMLSGGMDSGSIVAVANPISTYSLARVRSAACDESERIYATLDHLGLRGTQLIADDVKDLADDLGDDLDEPFDGEFLFLRALYDAARRDGCHVVLDGAAGDVVFNEGNYILRLLRRGRLLRAWRETAGAQAYRQQASVLPAYLRLLRNALLPETIRQLARPARQRRAAQDFVNASLISPEFAQRVDIDTRFERMAETFSGIRRDDVAREHMLKIRPNLTAGRERYARIAAAAGVTAADPYTDLRVVQFCAQLPDALRARNGWPKYLLRIAMDGHLPECVRWGRGKPHIGWLYNRTFLEREKARGLLAVEPLQKALGNYVDPVAVSRAWQDWRNGGSHEWVHSACILARWLENFVTRPVVKNQGFG